ncbi:hypothetical protein [Streptomyces sp. NPDC057287]|uniref:hypothetical protein n=1 Tax=Streptomyces sp. NPDC057287 TaxID=3346086 RepID=UPI0036455032
MLRTASPTAGGGRRNVKDSPPHGGTSAGSRPAPRAPAPSSGPVFVDLTGRRSRTWRRVGTIAALCCACYAATLVATLIGSDSSAPFLRLPRAMGLDHESGPRPTPTPDGGRSASPAAETSDGLPGPGALPAVGPSGGAAPEPLRASPGPPHIPAVDAAPAATPPRAPVSGTSGQPTQGAGGGGSSAAEPSTPPKASTGPETPADGSDGAQDPEHEGASPSGGLLGDLVGGLLGGLLGGR